MEDLKKKDGIFKDFWMTTPKERVDAYVSSKEKTVQDYNTFSKYLVDLQEHYPLIYSALQPYLPVQKPPKKRRPRKKKQTIAHLIDALKADINRGFVPEAK